MSTRLASLLLASALVLPLAGPACAQPPADPATSTATTASHLPSRAHVEDLLEAFDVPGLAIATLTGCAVDGVETYGLADLESGTPVAPGTVFEAASLSKPVFAWLVLQLADEGVIDLDAPIAGTIGFERVTDQAAYARITPRMVLSHSTGLPNWVGDSDDPARTDPIALTAAPGTAYSYSGEAYELLRRQVEHLTGQTLDGLFKARLGAVMPRSTFAGPLPDGAVASRGYASTRQPETGRGLENLRADGEGGAAGGLVTTAGDYARFLSAVCRGEGVSASGRAAMLEPVTPVPAGQYPAPTAWGLGWGIMQLGPETIVFHGGNNDEYRSMAGWLPATGEGFVFLTNGRNGSDLIDALIEELQP